MRKFYLLAAGAMLLASNAFAQTMAESAQRLFLVDPVTTLGAKDYTAVTGPTLAATGEYLIYCEGDGTAPFYANAYTGALLGTINLGDAVAASVTNDEAGNVLIVNHALGGETVNIYRTNDVTAAPTLYYTFQNPWDCPCGAKIKVNGNIEGDAIITLRHEGVDGITDTGELTFLVVKDGAVAEVVKKDLGEGSYWWGPAPVKANGVATRSANIEDGIFTIGYEEPFRHIAADGTITASCTSTDNGSLNPNCLDSKSFNGQNYLAHVAVSHWPSWGSGPDFFVFNTTDMTKFEGSSVSDVKFLEYRDTPEEWPQSDDFSVASGDVVLVPNAETESLYAYFVDHNSQALAGYILIGKAPELPENPDESGVADVVVDENAPVEYFNLQGVRVANPENGIFVRRQGNQVSKVVVK